MLTIVTVGGDVSALDPAGATVANVRPASFDQRSHGHGRRWSHHGAGGWRVLGALFQACPLCVRPTLVLHPTTCAKLAAEILAPDLTVTGGTAFGVNVVGTPGCTNTAGTTPLIVAMDAAAIGYADDGAEFSTTEHATIAMDSAPMDPADATVVATSLWKTISSAFALNDL